MQAQQGTTHRRRTTIVELEPTLRTPLDDALRQTVAGLLRRGERHVILDLQRLDAIDAAGIGELIAVFQTTSSEGGTLRITRPRRRVRRILDVAGVLGLLGAEPGVEAAAAAPFECRPHVSCVRALSGALSCA